MATGGASSASPDKHSQYKNTGLGSLWGRWRLAVRHVCERSHTSQRNYYFFSINAVPYTAVQSRTSGKRGWNRGRMRKNAPHRRFSRISTRPLGEHNRQSHPPCLMQTRLTVEHCTSPPPCFAINLARVLTTVVKEFHSQQKRRFPTSLRPFARMLEATQRALRPMLKASSLDSTLPFLDWLRIMPYRTVTG